MKNLIIALSVIILTTACQKSIEMAAPEEQEFLVYNQSLQCRPLESDNGFYSINLEDSVPWLVQIETSGKLNKLLDISSYFPEDLAFDSITNLNISHIGNQNIMIAFTFNYTENETSTAMIQAIEFQQDGSVVDELYQPLPTFEGNTFGYTAASKNENNEWVLISSYTNGQMGPNAESKLLLQISTFTKVNGVVEVNSTIETFSNQSISQAYTLFNGNIAILLSENQNLPPEMQTSGVYTLIKFYPNGTSSQIALEESFINIEVIKQIDEELLIVGSISRETTESTIKTLALNDANNIVWSNLITIDASFTPTCIITNSNNYVLGGLNGDTRDFSWNNVYLQTNTTLAMYAFDYDSQVIWHKNHLTEFTSLITGVCLNEDGYSWLLSKKSYDTYNNIAVLKTDFTGNIN